MLCAIGVLNIVLWFLSARSLRRNRGALTASQYTLRKQLLLIARSAVPQACQRRSSLARHLASVTEAILWR